MRDTLYLPLTLNAMAAPEVHQAAATKLHKAWAAELHFTLRSPMTQAPASIANGGCLYQNFDDEMCA